MAYAFRNDKSDLTMHNAGDHGNFYILVNEDGTVIDTT